MKKLVALVVFTLVSATAASAAEPWVRVIVRPAPVIVRREPVVIIRTERPRFERVIHVERFGHRR